ncbi:MAG: aspartate kinase [Christensenellaceae bacterium]|nr:aspartate kinase [Christensenellaceae bacterium]
MALIVTKFGGSSLASAEQFKKVKNIIKANPDRAFCVPSAPGKRFDGDEKITDLLYKLYSCVKNNEDETETFGKIRDRYVGIRDELGLSYDIEKELNNILAMLKSGESSDYAASRGEYLNGLLLAEYLGWEFLDAAEIIIFDKRGRYDDNATNAVAARVIGNRRNIVIPGFYGTMPYHTIKTFSRGGSDITGAIVAAVVNADLYENWTDVSGFLMADPRIVPHAKKIERITYRELRELSYMGATVLHEDAIFPVYNAAIPINVRNTNEPENSGTMILPVIDEERSEDDTAITGVAGKKGFSIISIEKNGMNSELGFGRRVLACVEKYGLPFEHMPSSIDTLCLVLEDKYAGDLLEDIVDDILRICEPDTVEIKRGLALIATVGRGMIKSVGCSAKLFTALANEHVNVRMIDQGSSELNIIVGIAEEDFERALVAIHNAFTS